MPTSSFEVDVDGIDEVEAAADWVRGAASGAATGGAVAGPFGAAVGAVAGGTFAAMRDPGFAPRTPAATRARALRRLAELIPVLDRLVAEAGGHRAGAAITEADEPDDPGDPDAGPDAGPDADPDADADADSSWAAAGDPDHEDD
jgi:hypothetical protein